MLSMFLGYANNFRSTVITYIYITLVTQQFTINILRIFMEINIFENVEKCGKLIKLLRVIKKILLWIFYISFHTIRIPCNSTFLNFMHRCVKMRIYLI